MAECIETLFRTNVRLEDVDTVRRIVTSSGFFYRDEVEVAASLVEERLKVGTASGYHFLFAEEKGTVVGYACFGPIPCTGFSYDLYWIALAGPRRGQGLGSTIMTRCEEMVLTMGGTRLYVETSSRPQYDPTRRFYERNGFRLEASLRDFYHPGDDKIIYVKLIKASESETPGPDNV